MNKSQVTFFIAIRMLKFYTLNICTKAAKTAQMLHGAFRRFFFSANPIP